jgi:Gametolysin peptidase M11
VKARAAAASLAAGALLVLAAPAGAVVGQVRTLVVLGTWGPQPYSEADAERVVFGEAAPWLARSSFGRMELVGDVTPWLRVPPLSVCDRDDVSREFRAAATRAGYAPDTYTRLVYLVPDLGCPYTGYGSGNEAFLMDALFRVLVVHELGHTFGLGHAKSRDCDAFGCRMAEYGDRYDTMGSGAGDFNAFEKFTLGWLPEPPRASADGVYSIEALERPSALPQALVIETASAEYWLDHREPEWDDASFRSTLAADNVFVHAGPPSSDPIAGGPYSEGNVLVAPPGSARQAFLTGDRLVQPGAFELAVLGRVGTSVQVRFAWTDSTPPARPHILTPGASVRRGSRPLDVTWAPSRERGSGLARYEVSLDGGSPVVVTADFRIGLRALLARPAAGRHTLRVVAVDRAGNRGAAAVRRLTVRR